MDYPIYDPKYGVATVKTGIDSSQRFYSVSGFRKVIETLSTSRRCPVSPQRGQTAAEYIALINGLSAALDLGFDEVEVLTTSNEVVQHIETGTKPEDKEISQLVGDVELLRKEFSVIRINRLTV